MFKLVLEKAEEPEIKLLTSARSSKKQESSRKNIYFCFCDYAKAFDCVDHKNWWKFWRRWKYQTTWSVMYECESWTIKKAEHQRINAFELWCWRRLLRVPWTARRSNHPKGDQFWVFTGRTDVEAETPILWPTDAKIWLIWKDPDARKDWGQEEKGMSEDEMVEWHHRLNGHESG